MTGAFGSHAFAASPWASYAFRGAEVDDRQGVAFFWSERTTLPPARRLPDDEDEMAVLALMGDLA